MAEQAVEKPKTPMATLETMKVVIQKYSSQMQQLIPKHVTGERIVNIALATLTRNPDLVKCDARTVLAGIINASIMGLELHSALHHASLVPFWNSKAGIFEANLFIEYPGLIELVMRGGQTSYVEAQPVFELDYLDVQYGTQPHLIHKPEIKADRGKLCGAYAYAKLNNGDTKFHVMSIDEINKRRAVSKAKDSGPWVQWTEEMAAKTPLRHLCKQLRKTTELALALAHEDRMDQDVTSVVEAPEGLSMDFLSMNIEAKTIDQKENLKGRIAAQSQSSGGKKTGQQQPAQPQAPQPQPPAPQPAPEPAAPQPQAPAPEPAAIPPAEEVDPDLASMMASGPPEQGTLPGTAPVQQQKDPLDEQIPIEEVRPMLEAIQSKGIPVEKVQAKIKEVAGKMTIMRNLTKRQKNSMVEWINSYAG